jgi:hypothetical protein
MILVFKVRSIRSRNILSGLDTDAIPHSPCKKPPPRGAPTYNIGSMIGSAIQHETRDSRIAVNYDAKSSEFRELVQHNWPHHFG